MISARTGGLRFVVLGSLLGIPFVTGAQAVRSELDAIVVAQEFLRALGRSFEGQLVVTEVSPPGSPNPDSYVVDTRLGECLIAVLAADGSIYSFHDARAEAELHSGKHGGERRFASADDALGMILDVADKMKLGRAWSILDWQSPGPRGKHDPYNHLAEVRLHEPAPGYEGSVNMCSAEVDLQAGTLIALRGNRAYQFDAPVTTLSRGDALDRLRAAWHAEAPHYVARGAKDLPWPGDAVCLQQAKMLACQPAGASAFTSDYGAWLERERKVRVCWTFGHGRFSVAVDAEDGRLVRSDLSKQATSRPGYGEPGYGAITPEVREHLRRAPERDRRQLLQFVAWIAVPSSVAIGIYLWMRRVNKSVLD
jgi:hypothetical protein